MNELKLFNSLILVNSNKVITTQYSVLNTINTQY